MVSLPHVWEGATRWLTDDAPHLAAQDERSRQKSPTQKTDRGTQEQETPQASTSTNRPGLSSAVKGLGPGFSGLLGPLARQVCFRILTEPGVVAELAGILW